MPERSQRFSEEEKSMMTKFAAKAAQLGNDGINFLVIQMARLERLNVETGLEMNPIIRGRDSEKIQRATEFLNATIHQARAQAQMLGVDDLSVLNSRLEKAGMGSLFDTESEAFKKFGSYFFSR